MGLAYSEIRRTDLVPHCDVVVSVVNHSNLERVRLCIASLQRERMRRYDIQVVVLDNGSTDGSVEALREDYTNVAVIAQPYRAGFGENHDRVIASTSSTYVFILNDDAEVRDGAIEHLVDFLEQNEHVGIVGPRIEHPSKREHQSAWRFPSPAICALSALTLGTFGIVQSRSPRSRPVDWVSGSAMMVRRSAFEAAGGFDETIYMYMEETDLCRRLKDAGWEVWFLPEALVVHGHWGSTASMPQRRVNELWRSRRYYWSKHHTAIGARLAAVFDAMRYGAGAGLALAARAVPDEWVSESLRDVEGRQYHLHALNALGHPTGAGIRELSLDFNARTPAWGGAISGAIGRELMWDKPDPQRFAARAPIVGRTKAACERVAVLARRRPRSARLAPGLRILTYHRVSDDPDQLSVSPEHFARQLDVIERLQLRVVDLATDNLSAAADESLVAITFDDGYQDVVDNALPRLRERQWPATAFVVPGAVERLIDFPWYRRRVHPPLVKWDEMRDIEASGVMRFEPHGFSHLYLPGLSRAAALNEIVDAKKWVDTLLQRPSRVFCYPGGYFSLRDVELVEESGFDLAVSCTPGLNCEPFSPYALRRTHVDHYDSLRVFRARLLGARDTGFSVLHNRARGMPTPRPEREANTQLRERPVRKV